MNFPGPGLRTGSLALLVVGWAGCSRLSQYSAPAPAGALDCAVAEAEDRGYARVSGDGERGQVRMVQRLRGPLADAAPPIDADRARRPDPREYERQLLMAYRDGMLRIEPIEPPDAGSRETSPGFAADHAAEILTLCGAPA